MPGSQFNPMPHGPGDLERRVRDLERLVQEMAAARTLENATIKAAAGLGVRTSDFNGTDFAHPGTAGNYFGGDGAVLNNIYLRGVLVGLDTPVLQKTYKVAASSFGLTVPWVEKAGLDITVPDGCTRVSVILMGKLLAVNPNTTGGADTTGTDALYVRVGLNGSFSVATPTGISGNGGFATTNALDSFDLTGLTPGSTIRLSTQGSSGYQSIASNSNNYINGIAAVTWMR